MKKMIFAFASILFTLGATGCTHNIPNKDEAYTPPASDSSTIQTYDIVTTTYTGSDELAVSAIVEPGVRAVKTDTGATTLTPTPSYTAAVNEYANNRFQFVSCSGKPGSMNIKKDTNFMLDNRDNKTHIFGIGKKTYTLNAYDFALVNVQKPGDYFITCDGGGAAKVSIQG